MSKIEEATKAAAARKAADKNIFSVTEKVMAFQAEKIADYERFINFVIKHSADLPPMFQQFVDEWRLETSIKAGQYAAAVNAHNSAKQAWVDAANHATELLVAIDKQLGPETFAKADERLKAATGDDNSSSRVAYSSAVDLAERYATARQNDMKKQKASK